VSGFKEGRGVLRPSLSSIDRSSAQPPSPSIVTLSVQLTVALIAGGRFVGLLPSSVAQFSTKRAGLKILPVKLPVKRFAAGIITVKGRTVSPLTELFIESAREIARSIGDPTEGHKSRSV
jgi:DNA-binding transcriptional LysR family regulator